MIHKTALMLLALGAGLFFSASVDSSTANLDQSDTQRAQAPSGDSSQASEHDSATLATPGDDSQTQLSAPPQVEVEVRTAEALMLVGETFTDGQVPAANAPVPADQAAAAPPAGEQAVSPDAPADSTAEVDPAPSPMPVAVPQTIFTDYKAAMQEAAEDRKLLFIYFHETRPNAAQRAFETLTLADATIKEQLQRYVVVRLPRDTTIKHNGEPIKLLEHAAFSEMQGRQGVAILDLAHERSEYYGHVVSTFPFTPGKYYRKEALSIILDLPPGTLTQRTMIYAVRIHPEAPASTQGIFHTALADEAKEHADYQASILLQGHHSWDSRFQRINSKLPGGVLAQEVVAESWPNEGLVEACVDCVHSWRQSPGHWGAVRSRHLLFGYDIKRGRNGIWYATGIFGRR